MGGPLPIGPQSQARISGGSCPASSTNLPLNEDPRPPRGGSHKGTKTSQISGHPQDQKLRADLNISQFCRIEFRRDFIPGRNQNLVRLTRGFQKLLQASPSHQGARIREDA